VKYLLKTEHYQHCSDFRSLP